MMSENRSYPEMPSFDEEKYPFGDISPLDDSIYGSEEAAGYDTTDDDSEKSHPNQGKPILRKFYITGPGVGDWGDQAACLEEDPELFFPVGNTGPALLQIEEAKAVCRRCDVASLCLKWALDTGQSNGVWGGMSEAERRAEKRRQGRAARIRDSD